MGPIEVGYFFSCSIIWQAGTDHTCFVGCKLSFFEIWGGYNSIKIPASQAASWLQIGSPLQLQLEFYNQFKKSSLLTFWVVDYNRLDKQYDMWVKICKYVILIQSISQQLCYVAALSRKYSSNEPFSLFTFDRVTSSSYKCLQSISFLST